MIETPTGQCNYSKGADICCEQLGYNYVSEDISEVEKTVWSIKEEIGSVAGEIFLPLLILLGILFGILKLKTGCFIPFADSYITKGLVIGFLVAILSSLSFYSTSHFSGMGYSSPLTTFFLWIGFPAYFLSPPQHNSFVAWITVPLINLVYFCSLGALVGFEVRKLKSKED